MALVCVQVDDTLYLADNVFADMEAREMEVAKILCKAREQLSPDNSIKFNGAIISESAQGVISLTQKRTINLIQPVAHHNADMTGSRGKVRENVSPKDQFVAQRALGAYVASLSQPEAAFDLSYAAQTTDPEKADIEAPNKRLKWQLENDEHSLNFVNIDMSTAKIVVFVDGSFANNKDYSSQIGYVIVLADANGNANILHWSSTKCKRITGSVLASELYALANGFDVAATIRDTATQILQLMEPLPLVICTDSKSLYECLVKLGSTQEKRLMIDLMALREAFERKEINEVKWIAGSSNPADAMTKAKPCAALSNLVNTNRLDLHVEGWTERAEAHA